MNNDIEKLSSNKEIQSKNNEIIDNFTVEDNIILNIPEDNIYMEFNIGNQKYVAFTEDSTDIEEINMIFAKLSIIDGERILRNIENTEEYQNVINEFYLRLQSIM